VPYSVLEFITITFYISNRLCLKLIILAVRYSIYSILNLTAKIIMCLVPVEMTMFLIVKNVLFLSVENTCILCSV